MKYLVTGATGFLGPYLVKELVDKGHQVRCLVRRTSKKKTFLKSLGAELVEGDITDAKSIQGTGDGMDRLVHMATMGHMSNFTVTESMFYQVNVNGTVNMMKEALDSGIKKILHCSTVAAMGICQDNPATEKSICSPHHPYGRSKLEAEKKVLEMKSENGLPAVITRFSMVYGPGDPRDILKLARLAQKGFFPKVGNRPKLTPLIHARDAVDGLLLAIEKGRAGEIYLITNSRSEPFDKIREAIQEGLGKRKMAIYIPESLALFMAGVSEKLFTFFGKTPLVSLKNMESTLADRVFSIEKAKNELGFHPETDPHEGLRQTILWYRENKWI